MGTNQSKLSVITGGCLSLIAGFVLIYIAMLTLTLGSSVISGFMVSLMFLKVGVVGFVFAVLLVLFNNNIRKPTILLLTVIINVISELAQGVLRGSGKPDKIGEIMIVRHNEVNDTLVGVGDVVLIVIVSSALLMMFFGFSMKRKHPL